MIKLRKKMTDFRICNGISRTSLVCELQHSNKNFKISGHWLSPSSAEK